MLLKLGPICAVAGEAPSSTRTTSNSFETSATLIPPVFSTAFHGSPLSHDLCASFIPRLLQTLSTSSRESIAASCKCGCRYNARPCGHAFLHEPSNASWFLCCSASSANASCQNSRNVGAQDEDTCVRTYRRMPVWTQGSHSLQIMVQTMDMVQASFHMEIPSLWFGYEHCRVDVRS